MKKYKLASTHSMQGICWDRVTLMPQNSVTVPGLKLWRTPPCSSGLSKVVHDSGLGVQLDEVNSCHTEILIPYYTSIINCNCYTECILR